MKFAALLLTAAVFGNSQAFAESDCLQTYLDTKEPQVLAAAEFLSDASSDVDYESMDQMVSYIRKAARLPEWKDEDMQDHLSFAIARIVNDSTELFCTGRPWTLDKIRARLLIIDLPEYYKQNPEEAKEALWIQD